MARSELVDAIVIGAGPNGLVAGNLLADQGWDVLVLEAQPTPGGAVRSAEITAAGYTSDLFSSFYPLALGSPVLRSLGLADYGLRWRHAPSALAHPLPDGTAAVLSRSVTRTAASVDALGPGDGAAWERLVEQWRDIAPALLEALFTPFPPIVPTARLLRKLGPAGAARFARFATLSVRRFAEEEFRGPGAELLIAGNAMHTDLAPAIPGGALFGWLLAMLGQQVGFPVPEGGSGRLTDALVARFTSAGGELRCGTPVSQVVVRHGQALGVRTATGQAIRARRAVLADVTAPQLYLELVGAEHIGERMLDDLRRFQWDNATIKLDWALSGPIPWRNEAVSGAGTVHLAGYLDDLSVFAHQLELRQLPAEPFIVLGQMTTTDPTRSPAGTESAWGYTHVPMRPRGDALGELRGDWTDPEERARFVERMEHRIEQFAPGFRNLIVGRHEQFPNDLQSANANLRCGALNGGTAGLHQELIFRPTPGLGRPETPIDRLYLASSSAHPGGGVHGGCGANAARAALRARTTGRLTLAATRAITGRTRPTEAPG